MRIALLISALAALAVAFPRPQDDDTDDSPDPDTVSLAFPTPTVSAVLSTSLNIPLTPSLAIATKSKRPHWEPIPVFTKECKCDVATVRYPCWATDALQKCNYEENFSYGCYMEAAGGCPTPTRVCNNLYVPTPITGRHPCDFGGGGPPLITSFPNITTLIPVVPTANVTRPILPTGNFTLPVLPTGNVTLPVTLPL